MERQVNVLKLVKVFQEIQVKEKELPASFNNLTVLAGVVSTIAATMTDDVIVRDAAILSLLSDKVTEWRSVARAHVCREVMMLVKEAQCLYAAIHAEEEVPSSANAKAVLLIVTAAKLADILLNEKSKKEKHFRCREANWFMSCIDIDCYHIKELIQEMILFHEKKEGVKYED